MRFLLTAFALFLSACEPPPVGEGGGLPAVRIIYPPSDSTIPMTRRLGPPVSCALEVVVAIDVDNFEVVEPASADGEVDGQGHFHVQVLDRPYVLVTNQYALLDEGDLAPGDIVTITATLQSNTHADLDQFPDWSHTIEITMGDPEGGDLLGCDE